MGQACGPENRGKDKMIVVLKDTEKKKALEEVGPSEKLTKIIHTYQAENAKMRKELDLFKNKDEQDIIAREEATQQNEKIMHELAHMKAMLAVKDQTLVKHQLVAALYKKATSLVSSESVAKLLKEGKLEKFARNRKAKSGKEKWVKIELHNCQHTQSGFERGYMMLIYSDSRDSQLSNRCQIISLNTKVANVDDKLKGRNFLVRALVGGVEKELFFACTDEKLRNEWVEAFNSGFFQIEEEEMDMRKPFFLTVQFSNDKLGIRIEEKVLGSKQEDLGKQGAAD